LIINEFISECSFVYRYWDKWEEGSDISNKFHDGCEDDPSFVMEKLATLDRASLKLIRSKCFRVQRKWWLFIKGALTA
jgi:hypothetical protein